MNNFCSRSSEPIIFFFLCFCSLNSIDTKHEAHFANLVDDNLCVKRIYFAIIVGPLRRICKMLHSPIPPMARYAAKVHRRIVWQQIFWIYGIYHITIIISVCT